MPRVLRTFIRAWGIIFPALLVSAALATIAPQWFQVHQGAIVTSLLLNPATLPILAALIVVWLAVYLRRLESRVEALEKRPEPGSFGDVTKFELWRCRTKCDGQGLAE